MDVGLLRTPRPSSELAFEPLLSQRLSLVVAPDHHLARRSRVRYADLRNEGRPIWPRAEAAETYDAIIEACRRAGFSPRLVQEAVLLSRSSGSSQPGSESRWPPAPTEPTPSRTSFSSRSATAKRLSTSLGVREICPWRATTFSRSRVVSRLARLPLARKAETTSRRPHPGDAGTRHQTASRAGDCFPYERSRTSRALSRRGRRQCADRSTSGSPRTESWARAQRTIASSRRSASRSASGRRGSWRYCFPEPSSRSSASKRSSRRARGRTIASRGTRSCLSGEPDEGLSPSDPPTGRLCFGDQPDSARTGASRGRASGRPVARLGLVAEALARRLVEASECDRREVPAGDQSGNARLPCERRRRNRVTCWGPRRPKQSTDAVCENGLHANRLAIT